MKRYFDHLSTLSEIKAEYKRLAKANHPDVGGDTATMQAINGQYEEAVERIKRFGERVEREAAAQEVPAEFIAIINAVVGLGGIAVDLVGAWLWVTGNTFPHKDALKAAGFKWASKKKAWYWHPEHAASLGSKKSLEQIKAKYGSQRIAGTAGKTAHQITA